MLATLRTNRVHPAFTAVTVILAAFVLITYYITAFSDAGYVKRRENGIASSVLEAERRDMEEKGVPMTYCRECDANLLTVIICLTRCGDGRD